MTNQQHICSFCRNQGKLGKQVPEWLLRIPGDADCRVHKPCGLAALAHPSAPQGAKVAPSPELRARWDAEKAALNARSFWAEKFAQAEGRKKPSPPAPTAVAAE